MKKLNILVFMAVWLVAILAFTEDSKPLNPGWSAEEAVFSQALAIRAKKLEKISRIKFDKNTEFKTSIEYGLPQGAVAGYEAETQTIRFAVSWLYDLNREYKKSVRLLDPEAVANYAPFAQKADHALGQLLMDQVSRRSKNGAWFTQIYFHLLKPEEKLGLNIMSEGVGTYFEYLDSQNAILASSECLPANPEQQRFYRYDIVAFQGGYWLVHDILKKYKERGLVWMIEHRFVAVNNMREEAVKWRQRALKELAKK